ncbi:MAG: FHA domain-containing protein, partial [Microbacterium sp.]
TRVPSSHISAAPPAPPLPAAPPLDPPSGADELDETRAAASPRAVLMWDDGTRVAIYGRTLFGRNPAPETDAVVVAVRDETLSLSKTHFEVQVDGGGVWVVDRHSTNGTVLLRDAERRELAGGERAVLRAGDRLEFGDRRVTVGSVA